MLQCSHSDRAERAGARRQHLLDTARALFVSHGFHQTGVAQIARASGIGVGQIYRDFACKEAIIAAIAEADVTAWLEEDRLAAAVAAGDRDAIGAWIRRFSTYDGPQDKCRMMAEVVAEAGRNPHVAGIYRCVDQRVRASLSAALAALAGTDPQEPRVAELVECVLAIGTGIKSRRVINPELAVDRVAELVTRMLDTEIAALAGC